MATISYNRPVTINPDWGVRNLLEAMKKGDKVVSIGGLHGTIVAVKEQIDLGRELLVAVPEAHCHGKVREGIHLVGHVSAGELAPAQGHQPPLQRSGTAGEGRCQCLQVAPLEGRGIGGGVAQLGKGHHLPCRHSAGLTVPQAGEYVHLIVERQGNGRGHLSCPEVNGHIPDKIAHHQRFIPQREPGKISLERRLVLGQKPRPPVLPPLFIVVLSLHGVLLSTCGLRPRKAEAAKMLVELGAGLLALEIGHGIVQRGVGDGAEGFVGEEALVGRHDDIGEGQKPCGGGVHEDVILPVFEDVLGLLLVDIQTHAEELVLPDARDQVIGLDEAAAGGVDQDHAVLHLLDGLEINHVVGAVHEGAVQGDEVAGGKQGVEIHIGHEGQVGILVHVVGNHLHAEALADPRHGRADLAGAHNAGGLAVEVDAQKSLEAEVILPHLDIGLVEVPVHSQRQRHGVLGHSLGRVAGDAHHPDAQASGDVQIHVVKAGAAHEHQLHAPFVELLQHRGADVGAYKRADGLGVDEVRGGFDGELGLPVFQLQLGVLSGNLRKGLTVIGFCREKNNFHGNSSFV